MVIKLYKKFFNNDKDKGVPNHLLKINFIILNISKDWDEVKIKIESHPAFTTRKGFNYKPNLGCITTYSGKEITYKKDELTGMEFTLSKRCFYIGDINNFENWDQGDTF